MTKFFQGLFRLLGGAVRIGVFWGLFGLATYGAFKALGLYWPEMSVEQLQASIADAPSPVAVFRDKKFAIGLAGLIAAMAIGFWVAYFVAIVRIRLSLEWNRRQITRSHDEAAFALNLEETKRRLSKSRFVGHAFQQFAKTIFVEDGNPPTALSTARPQAFVNMAALRERSVALQLMPSVPGYFVGLGLLLTFIGLIAALSVAAPSVNAGNADQAKDALNQLLDAATFKFATSIAGLGGSLFLSLFFKLWVLLVERGIGRFCEAAEERMRFISPQEISREIAQTLRSQLTHLQNIDSDGFFDRFGQNIAPHIKEAMGAAVAPLAANVVEAAQNMRDQSSGGLRDMLDKFSETLRGSAGAELNALATTLAELKVALDGTRTGLQGSGEDFSKRLTDAVETMTRRLGEATDKLSGSANTNSKQLEESVSRLALAFEEAAQKAHGELTRAAQDAGGSMGAAVESIVVDIRSTIQGLSREIAALAGSLAAQSETAEKTARAMSEVARNAEATGEAFGAVARDLRDASRPLTDSSTKIADSAATIARAVADASGALISGQSATHTLAAELKDHAERIKSFWASYEARFANVDQQLAGAIKSFGEQVVAQQARVIDYTKEIDKGFTKAVDNLNGAINNLGEQAEGVRDAMEQFSKNVESRTTRP